METIFFSAALHEEIKDKIFIYQKLEMINNFINLKNYTNSLNELIIIFQAINPKSPRKVTEFKRLRRKTKTLELYLILDYERIMQGSDQENLQHIKEVFLKGCETFLKPLKGFKWNEFNNQIQNILK